MDLQIAFENLVRLINDTSFVPFAVGFVLIVTQVLKTLAIKVGLIGKGDTSRTALLALIVQVAVWVGYSYFKSRGEDAAFENFVKGAETILTTLVTVLFPAVLSAASAHAVYNRLHKQDVPGFRVTPRKAA